MVRLMNRSIDLLEEWARATDNAFRLNRRGYVYATAQASRIPEIERTAREISALGAGGLRVHHGAPDDPAYQPAPAEGFEDQPAGADLILDPKLIREHFPYLTEQTVAVLHARRCGWFSAYQLGMWWLEQAKARGAKLIEARVVSVEVAEGQIESAHLSNGETLTTRCFVNAAGPFLRDVGQLVGIDLPLYSERHHKLAFTDSLNAIPSDAPLLIWEDAQFLPWSDEERAAMEGDPEAAVMLGRFPPGVHTRPDGPAASPIRLMLWDYHGERVEPVLPVPMDEMFPEFVLRGLATMIPGLRAYFDRPPKPVVDGGYYTKTKENRPLVGPLPVRGGYVIGALSGYGVMAAPAAGELLAAHIVGGELPAYASLFGLERYSDPAYQRLLENWGNTGQL
jgi:glycine/D-amino acid oxidase-like deaminating enzyme